VNPLRGQNNVQGAAHMGCDPDVLTGGVPLDTARAGVEAVWGAPVPRGAGLRLPDMMRAAARGRLKALWAIGYDVLLTNPDARSTLEALQNLELVIVQDLFMTETARAAGTVFLPAASSFEKDGTFMNAERRIQRIRPAVPPRRDSRPDWQIVCDVARAMGKGDGFRFESPEEVWREVRDVWEPGRGIGYERLEPGGGLQWPCPAVDHEGTVRLHASRFAIGERARLATIDFHPTEEAVSDAFPYLLNTGRTLFQFNAGTMTARTPNAELRPTDLLDIAEADAAALGIADTERVRIVSRYGTAVLPARVSSTVQPGQLFATFHSPEVFLNQVTGPRQDAVASTPEYKVTAVRLERL
jgi:formate dehydrogenase major subunit